MKAYYTKKRGRTIPKRRLYYTTARRGLYQRLKRSIPTGNPTMNCVTCSNEIPTGIYPFNQCGKCIDSDITPPKTTKDTTCVKLAFTQFDVDNWEILVQKGDINDKLLLKQIRKKGIKNRNVAFAFSEKENYYTVFSCNTVPEPIGNITIKAKK